jgi:succinoglycan biosynthesis protein ExoA
MEPSRRRLRNSQPLAIMTNVCDPFPTVSVLIPTLNEEFYIAKCLDSLLNSGYPKDRLEIIIADGGSTDKTREILSTYQKREPKVRWIPNPLVHQAGGVNVAAAAASVESKYFIRVDAHALYPSDFLPDVVATAEETGAELVVYVNEPHFETCFQRAVAFAFAHRLGVGDSKYRLGNFSGDAEHGQHGCFRRECFESLGGYDPQIMPNEDAELSWRVRQSGGRIYLNSRLRMKYFPRRTLRALGRQYFLYGYGRALNCYKHRQLPRPRQMAPPFLVGFEIILLIVALFRPLALILLAPYLLLIAAVTIEAVAKSRSLCLTWLAPVFCTMHHVWAVGFFIGCIEGQRRKVGVEISNCEICL